MTFASFNSKTRDFNIVRDYTCSMPKIHALGWLGVQQGPKPTFCLISFRYHIPTFGLVKCQSGEKTITERNKTKRGVGTWLTAKSSGGTYFRHRTPIISHNIKISTFDIESGERSVYCLEYYLVNDCVCVRVVWCRILAAAPVSLVLSMFLVRYYPSCSAHCRY